MNDYIFYNILAVENSKLQCNAEGNVAKQGHKAERIAPTATQGRATVNSVPELHGLGLRVTAGMLLLLH